MPWFWIVFVIIGSLGAIIYCKLDNNSESSQNNSYTPKEKSANSMITELQSSNHTKKAKNESNEETHKPNNPVRRSKYEDVLENTREYIILCREIDKFGVNGNFFVYLHQEKLITHFYIRHTFRNVKYLLYAHDFLQEGNLKMAEYNYDQIIRNLPNAIKKESFFLYDFSDFCAVLRGGLDIGMDYIKFTRNHDDIIIDQRIGCCGNKESQKCLMAIQNEIDKLIN